LEIDSQYWVDNFFRNILATFCLWIDNLVEVEVVTK